MLLEHVFVTTLDPNEALRRASEFLGARGFVSTGGGFQVESQWTTLEVRRGQTNPAKAKGIPDLPQTVRIVYDRGRVNMAIAMPAYKRAFWTGVGEYPPAHVKAIPHGDLLMAIARSVEAVMTQPAPPPETGQDWAALEASLRAQGMKEHRRRRITLYLAVVFVIAMFVLLIVAVVNS